MGSQKVRRPKRANKERVQRRRIRRLATSPVFLNLVPAEGATS